MTTLTPGKKWRRRWCTRPCAGPERDACGLSLTIMVSFGGVLSTMIPAVPFLASWLWIGLSAWGRGSRFARAHVALALGFGAAMLGVVLCQTDLGPPLQWPTSHPAFGEHPVTVTAGFPWQGVEGVRPHPLAQDCVPFTMGVDALLVNLSVFAVLFYALLRLLKVNGGAGLLVAAGLFAAITGTFGAWELVTMFD